MPALPLPFCREVLLGPDMVLRQWDLGHPVEKEFGQWALDNRLYSQGSDFTSGRSDYRFPGRSALKNLWSGRPSAALGASKVWVIFHKNTPVGVVAWEKSQGKKGWVEGSEFLSDGQVMRCLGRISLWMNPAWRGRGWMQEALREGVVPALNQEAALLAITGEGAFLRGADATLSIMAQTGSPPMVDGFSWEDPPAFLPKSRLLRRLTR